MSAIESACVIDDDEIFVYWATKMIREVDLCKNTIVYQNGQDAIEGLKKITEKGEKLPDIIFLDLNMPIKDGWGFLADFISIPNLNTKEILVYIVSSSIAQEDLEKAKQYDIVHNYILKPITIEYLKEIKASYG